jgi:type I restriction enzyme S subunit
MKPYPKYKDSGIEWIGEIPEHWLHSKLKLYCDKITDGSHFSPASQDEGFPYVSVKDVGQNAIDTINCKKISKEDFDELERNGCRPIQGDILLTKDGTIGRAAIVEENDFVILSSLGLIRPNKKFDNRFLRFYLISELNVDQMLSYIHGSALKRLTIVLIKNLTVIIPPPQEQTTIANFLDHKTAQIDQSIEKQRALIELLREHRAAIINEAVTKGIDPDVPMKDSGIEWIGEIPAHWETVKLKFLTKKIIDGTHFTPTYTETGIPFIRVTDLKNEVIDLSKTKYISKEEHLELTKRCMPEKGDVLLSKNGTIGITKVVDWEYEFSLFVSVCLIKFTNRLNPYFFSYLFSSNVVDQQIKESSKTTSVTNLHLDKIRELLSIVPPIQEQQQIVQYIETETSRIDREIDTAQKEIELLEEYRQALIAEAVTGKIDVRDYVLED